MILGAEGRGEGGCSVPELLNYHLRPESWALGFVLFLCSRGSGQEFLRSWTVEFKGPPSRPANL